MRAAIIAAILSCMTVWLPSAKADGPTPPAPQTTKASPSEAEPKATFLALQQMRKMILDRREVVDTYRNYAPYEAARCILLMDKISELVVLLQEKVLRGESISEHRESLDKIFCGLNQALKEFKREALRAMK